MVSHNRIYRKGKIMELNINELSVEAQLALIKQLSQNVKTQSVERRNAVEKLAIAHKVSAEFVGNCFKGIASGFRRQLHDGLVNVPLFFAGLCKPQVGATNESLNVSIPIDDRFVYLDKTGKVTTVKENIAFIHSVSSDLKCVDPTINQEILNLWKVPDLEKGKAELTAAKKPNVEKIDKTDKDLNDAITEIERLREENKRLSAEFQNARAGHKSKK